MVGEHYRKLWATPVTVKVFHLEKEQGGLKILKKGGGSQTKLLRLEDKNGTQWVLRTIQKYPERSLPSRLKETIAKTIMQDQIAATNPFASLTVPILAQAADIPHSNPQIVYVPFDRRWEFTVMTLLTPSVFLKSGSRESAKLTVHMRSYRN